MIEENMWKKIRKDHKMTLEEVARKIGCSKQHVSYMESGRRKKTLDYQIFILELRGEEMDLVNASYLRNVKNEIERNKKRTIQHF